MAKDAPFVIVHRKNMGSRSTLLKQPGVKEIEEVVAHGAMFRASKLEDFCTFLNGFDVAFHGVALLGLAQWLALKRGVTDPGAQHWTQGLAKAARREAGRSASESKLVATACAILKRFFSYRRRYGVKKLYADYNEWRRRQLATREDQV